MISRRHHVERAMQRFGADPAAILERPFDLDSRLWELCVHEVGHAIAAEVQGIRVERVVARVGPDSAAWMWWPKERVPAKRIRVWLAGSAAEVLFFGRFHARSQSGPWVDMEYARGITEACGQRWDMIAAVRECAAFLRPYKPAIEAIAGELRVDRELPGERVRELMALHPPERPKGNRRARRRKR